MYQFIELGTSITECIMIHILFNNWHGLRNLSTRRILLYFVGYFLINCTYTLLPIVPFVRAICSMTSVFCIVYLVYDLTLPMAVLGTVLIVTTDVLAEYLCMALMGLFSLDSAMLMSYGPPRVLYICLAKLISLSLVVTLSVIMSRNKSTIRLPQIGPIVFCQLFSLYIIYLFTPVLSTISDYAGRISIGMVGLLYINGLVVLFIQSLSQKQALQQEYALATLNFQNQLEYYRQLQQEQEETRALWHDISKYVLAIQATAEGNSDALPQEYDIIWGRFQEIGRLVDVENNEISAILNHWVQKAENHGIVVQLDVFVPPKISVSAVDMSIIIGNTMDNAIQAASAAGKPQPVIHLMLKQVQDMLFYAVDNPCSQDVPKKEKRKGHGYGLKNIRRCVEAYHGSFESEIRDGRYYTEIRLGEK